jgi:dipeptidase E
VTSTSGPRIVAFGGASLAASSNDARLLEYLLDLSGQGRPRICFVGTASGDNPESLADFYAFFARRAEASHLGLFDRRIDDIEGLLLDQDVIYVGGGNTANLLAIWRAHGFDEIIREAWERGIVLAGSSAGMICWFEAGVTDSFGPQLEGMRDGLGFLPGSACPHYDGEEQRRPVYTRLVANGFPAGIAADDTVGLHYVGRELQEAVTVREGAHAYRVEPGNEIAIEPRLLEKE